MRRKKKPIIIADSQSQWSLIWARYRKDKVAMAASIVLLFIIFLSLTADLFFDYNAQALQLNITEKNLTPCADHWMGTDNFGRDILARVVYGSRYSLFFGIGCTAVSLLFGSLLGAAAAYWGGLLDDLLMRFLDAWMCIPSMLLMLLMVAVMGTGMVPMMIAITISSIPGFTRIVRSVVLSIVSQDYIEAARISGVKDHIIICRHIIPNAIGSIIVNGMMSISGTIMSAAGLSYIGMGIQPPIPEWGSMLNEAMDCIRLYPHNAIYPGIAIIVTALCFNIIGDGLADAVDPRRNSN